MALYALMALTSSIAGVRLAVWTALLSDETFGFPVGSRPSWCGLAVEDPEVVEVLEEFLPVERRAVVRDDG